MSMTKPFSGPNSALLWAYARSTRLWGMYAFALALLLYTMIRLHTEAGALPVDVGQRLTRLLLIGSAAASVTVAVLGPTPDLDRGILAIYLALRGRTAPVFAYRRHSAIGPATSRTSRVAVERPVG